MAHLFLRASRGKEIESESSEVASWVLTGMNIETRVYDKKPEGFSANVEVAAIYVNVNNQLLLLELSSSKLEKGKWGVPAGKLEIEERPSQGAKRELFEETGIDFESESFFLPIGKLFIRKPEIDYVYHLFKVNLNYQPSIYLSKEHCSYRWVSRQEAKNLPLMNGGKEALDVYYQCSNATVVAYL